MKKSLRSRDLQLAFPVDRPRLSTDIAAAWEKDPLFGINRIGKLKKEGYIERVGNQRPASCRMTEKGRIERRLDANEPDPAPADNLPHPRTENAFRKPFPLPRPEPLLACWMGAAA